MKRATGYLPDPPGYRRAPFHHLKARLVGAPIPSSAFVTPLPLVLDQGPTGSCTAHATSTAFYTFLGWLSSMLSIYCNGRAIDRSDPRIPLSDDGAEPNQVFRAVNEFGVRHMTTLAPGRMSDVTESNVNDEPQLGDLIDEAEMLLVGDYAITSTGQQRVDDVCTALVANRPVCVAIAGGSDAFQSYTGGVLPVLNAGLDHYVVLTGYRTNSNGRREFRGRNSWGDSWGDNGDFWLSEDGLQELGDLVVVDVRRPT